MGEDAFKYNATLVHEAAKRGHLECLEVLVEHGAAVNGIDEGGSTPLQHAAYNKHVDSVIFLVQNGSPLDVINDEGMTAFSNAVRVGHVGIVRYLHRQGAILHIRTAKHPLLSSSLEVLLLNMQLDTISLDIQEN